MSRTYRGKDRRIRVRAIRRDRPDLRKLSRAVIMLAQAQAEKEATASHARSKSAKRRRQRPGAGNA